MDRCGAQKRSVMQTKACITLLRTTINISIIHILLHNNTGGALLYVSLHISVYLSIYFWVDTGGALLYVSLHISIYLSIYFWVDTGGALLYVSPHMSIHLSIYLWMDTGGVLLYVSLHTSIYLSIYLWMDRESAGGLDRGKRDPGPRPLFENEHTPIEWSWAAVRLCFRVCGGGAAVPAAACRWGLCPHCPGVGRCLSLAFTRYFHHQYCMVYGGLPLRWGGVYCAMVVQ